MNGKRVILATAGVAFAAGLMFLRAQEQAAPAEPAEVPAQGTGESYLVLHAPTIPSGDSSDQAQKKLQQSLNEAATRGYRVVGVTQSWVIMENVPPPPNPESKARRRVVLPKGD